MLAFAAVSLLSLLTHQATRHGRPGFHPCNSGAPLVAITQRDPSAGHPAPHSIRIVSLCETATVILGEQYRRIARRRGKQKAIVAVSRVICEIACILISDPGARFTDLGADYYSRGDSRRQTRSRIRELERLNPGMKVTLTPVQQAA